MRGWLRINWFNLIGALFLFFALGDRPYDFYQFLRIVICVITGYGGFVSLRTKRYGWSWILFAMAVLFNPFFPMSLSKGNWQALDFIGVVVLLVHALNNGRTISIHEILKKYWRLILVLSILVLLPAIVAYQNSRRIKLECASQRFFANIASGVDFNAYVTDLKPEQVELIGLIYQNDDLVALGRAQREDWAKITQQNQTDLMYIAYHPEWRYANQRKLGDIVDPTHAAGLIEKLKNSGCSK